MHNSELFSSVLCSLQHFLKGVLFRLKLKGGGGISSKGDLLGVIKSFRCFGTH